MAHRTNGTARRSHRWYQLHKSTWIVLAVASILWALIAVPRGQTPDNPPSYCIYGYPFVYRLGVESEPWPPVPLNDQQRLKYNQSLQNRLADFLRELDKRGAIHQLFGFQLIPTERFQHERYGQREGHFPHEDRRFWSELDRWNVLRQHQAGQFFIAGLIADVVVYLAGLGILAVVYENRRRRRVRFFQLSLLDIGLLFLLVSGCLGYAIKMEHTNGDLAKRIECLEQHHIGIGCDNFPPIGFLRAADYPEIRGYRSSWLKNEPLPQAWSDWWTKPTEISLFYPFSDFDSLSEDCVLSLESTTQFDGLRLCVMGRMQVPDDGLVKFVTNLPNPENIDEIRWSNMGSTIFAKAQRDTVGSSLARFHNLTVAEFDEVDFSNTDPNTLPSKLEVLVLEDCSGSEAISNWIDRLSELEHFDIRLSGWGFAKPSVGYDEILEHLPTRLHSLDISDRLTEHNRFHVRIESLKQIGRLQNLNSLRLDLFQDSSVPPDLSWLKDLKNLETLHLWMPDRPDDRLYTTSELRFPIDGCPRLCFATIVKVRLDDAFVDWLIKTQPAVLTMRYCEISDRIANRLAEIAPGTIFDECKFYFEEQTDSENDE